MKSFSAFVLLLLLAGMAFGQAVPSPKNAPAKAATSVLPQAFGGWDRASDQSSNDAATADPVNAELLKEYGFKRLEDATYTKGDRKITVKAASFEDATGAYGAFTFYKTPDMLVEKFGDQGATFNNRVVFYKGNVLVNVELDRVTAMTAAELRELGDDIPLPDGPQRNPPLLPTYLPKQGYVKNSAKYVEGPRGLAAVGSPVPADVVDFGRGAEVTVGKYSADEGNATMVLIGYPTPQIAAERLKAVGNFQPAGVGTFMSRRTGPIVAIVAGPISPNAAKSLLASVNYDADITWNENTHFTKRDNVGNLLYNVVLLVIILLGFALVLGLLFAAVRVLNRKLFPDRGFDRAEGREFISLHLHDRL